MISGCVYLARKNKRITCFHSNSLCYERQAWHMVKELYVVILKTKHSRKIICFRIFGGAIGVSSFLNLFIPGACQVSPGFVMFVRVLQGLVEVSVMNMDMPIKSNFR